MGSRVSRDQDEKLRRIMDAAVTSFSRSGYQGATMQDVASEAGVGKGTIYIYFSSKEELLETVLLDVLTRYRDQIREVITSDAESKEKLRRLLTEVLEGADRQRRQFGFLLQSSWGMRGEFKRQALAIKKDIMRSLSEFISRGTKDGVFRDVNPAIMAHIISGTLDSLAAAQLWSDEEIVSAESDDTWAEDLAEAVVDCLWNGVKVES